MPDVIHAIARPEVNSQFEGALSDALRIAWIALGETPNAAQYVCCAEFVL